MKLLIPGFLVLTGFALAATGAAEDPSVETAMDTEPPGLGTVAPRRPFADFAVNVGGVEVSLRVLMLGVDPGTTVPIRAVDAGSTLRVEASSGRLQRGERGGWRWVAPRQAGFHDLVITRRASADTVRLTFAVYRPLADAENGVLNGYRIGAYRPRTANRSVAYEAPSGLIEARPADYDRRVSPNFRLRDFLCKDPGDPRYLLVTPQLLEKLEAVLVGINDAGYATPSLTVMSGFRTPAYNRAIGNTTDFSRHLWGDAADVYVDRDGNGEMDDLNGDGRVDVRDARWLSRVVDSVMAGNRNLEPGGLSVYRRNAVRGPFVHIDARGRRARW